MQVLLRIYKYIHQLITHVGNDGAVTNLPFCCKSGWISPAFVVLRGMECSNVSTTRHPLLSLSLTRESRLSKMDFTLSPSSAAGSDANTSKECTFHNSNEPHYDIRTL